MHTYNISISSLTWLYPAYSYNVDRHWWAKCDNIEVSFNFVDQKAFISLIGRDGGSMVVAEGVFVRVEPYYAVADFTPYSQGGWLVGVTKNSSRGGPAIYAHFRGQSEDVCYPNLSIN
jgi:hypothetical protein